MCATGGVAKFFWLLCGLALSSRVPDPHAHSDQLSDIFADLEAEFSDLGKDFSSFEKKIDVLGQESEGLKPSGRPKGPRGRRAPKEITVVPVPVESTENPLVDTAKETISDNGQRLSVWGAPARLLMGFISAIMHFLNSLWRVPLGLLVRFWSGFLFPKQIQNPPDLTKGEAAASIADGQVTPTSSPTPAPRHSGAINGDKVRETEPVAARSRARQVTFSKSTSGSSSARASVPKVSTVSANPAAVTTGGRGPASRGLSKNATFLVNEITDQLRQQGGHGKVFVENYRERFYEELGSLQKFLESHPDKFALDFSGGGLTVKLVRGRGPGQRGQAATTSRIPVQATIATTTSRVQEQATIATTTRRTRAQVAIANGNASSSRAEEATREIRAQLEAQGGKGFVWIDRWSNRFQKELGTLKQFLESRPETFVVVHGSGRSFSAALRSAMEADQQYPSGDAMVASPSGFQERHGGGRGLFGRGRGGVPFRGRGRGVGRGQPPP